MKVKISKLPHMICGCGLYGTVKSAEPYPDISQSTIIVYHMTVLSFASHVVFSRFHVVYGNLYVFISLAYKLHITRMHIYFDCFYFPDFMSNC